MSGSILYPSVCPRVRGHFAIFVFVIISSVGSSINMLLSVHWETVKIICLSVHTSVSLYVFPVIYIIFWQSSAQPVITYSYCSRISCGEYPEEQYNISVWTPAWSFAGLLRFCICINFLCGVPVSRFIYPQTGILCTPVVSSRYYMSVYISVLMSGCPRWFLVIIFAAYNYDQNMQL